MSERIYFDAAVSISQHYHGGYTRTELHERINNWVTPTINRFRPNTYTSKLVWVKLTISKPRYICLLVDALKCL